MFTLTILNQALVSLKLSIQSKVPETYFNFLTLCWAVSGNYAAWSAWSECDKSCGLGNRVRSRSCTNPNPQFGGSDCSILGPKKEVQACYLPVCPGKYLRLNSAYDDECVSFYSA